ncbi:MAG: TolC family protein [Deltaproteobacteria bacterium]|nr:TolC family protein [Deltaproteobacteria bacterium]
MMKPFFFAFLLVLSVLSVFPGLSCGLSLEEAVDLALVNNPDLKKQRMNRSLSEKDLAERKSQNFGQIGLVASYGHYNLPRTLAPLTPASILSDPYAVPTTQDLFTTGIMYEVPLFTGFAQQRSVEIAAMQKEMAGVALKLSEEELIYNVKTLYVNALALERQEAAQNTYVQALATLLEDIRYEVKLGKKARVDQLKAAADLENALAQESRIKTSIVIVKATLAGLLNVTELPPLEAVPVDRSLPETIDPGDAIPNLDRYQYAVMEVEKNAKLVEKSKADYYPQVTFNAFVGQNFGPNDYSNRYSGEWNNQEIWQAVVNLKWNIFDFGARESAGEKARIRKRQSEMEKLKTALDLKKSLVEATAKIKTAVDEYRSARAEQGMTGETENIEQVRFDNGAINVNDLLYAKARNQQAMSRLISAEYACLSAQFYLDYLLEDGKNK